MKSRRGGENDVLGDDPAVHGAQFIARNGGDPGKIPVLFCRDRIGELGIEIFEKIISARIRRCRLYNVARLRSDRYPLNRRAVCIPDVSADIRRRFLLLVSRHQTAVLVKQNILIGNLRIDRRPVIRPAVPVPGSRLASRCRILDADLVHLTERNADGVVFFDHDLRIRDHDFNGIPRIICLIAIVQRAVERDLVVDQAVPAAPLTARTLHDARLAVNAEIDLIIVALRIAPAVRQGIKVKLNAVSARDGVIVGHALRQKDIILYFKQEEQSARAAVNLNVRISVLPERRKRLYPLPLLVVPKPVDRQFRIFIVPGIIEIPVSRLFIGRIVLINIGSRSAGPAARLFAGGLLTCSHRQHGRSGEGSHKCQHSLFHTFSSFFFPNDQPFTPLIAKDSIKNF